VTAHTREQRLNPWLFITEKDGAFWLCTCKQTGNKPYCDGSHKQFSAEQLGKEAPENNAS